MAKGTAMGVWRGKKGSNVFYYLRNSKNAQKQGIRERVYEISNPQTDGQTDQRMKMLPLQRLGATLGTIVRRSWEGVEYGGKTWHKFLSANMGSNSTLPFVDKEDDRTIPGDIQVSKGSLDSIGITYDDVDASTDIILSTDIDTPPQFITIGQLSTLIINNNPQIKEGDQLTIISCTTDAQGSDVVLDAHYYWSFASFIVNASDTTNKDTLNLRGAYLGGFGTGNDYRLGVLCATTANWVVAVAVIHSRLGDTGKYLRSTQRLVLSGVINDWFSSSRHSAARRTYKRSTAAASTNWPVDPDAAIEGTVPGSYTISGLTGAKASCNGKSCWVRRYEDTNELAAVYVTEWLGEPSNTLVDKSNNQAMSYTSEMQGVPLGANDVTALANLPQIQWDGEPTS